MIKYEVHYCLRDDPRTALVLDAYYDTFSEAVEKSVEMETYPEIYTTWVYERRIEK